MTALTTLCSMVPLALIPGEGTALYRAVGVIVLFGLPGETIANPASLPARTSDPTRST